MIVEMIILTKSFKHGCHCIAGINAVNGEWIRLVTNDADTEGAVPDEDARYADGSPAEVLDCVKVDLSYALPTNAQSENRLYNRSFRWQFVRKYTINEVLRLHPLDMARPIFGSYDNYCTEQDLDGHSLLLVMASRPAITVTTYDNEYGSKTKVYFYFSNNNIDYSRFSVSDRDLYTRCKQNGDGTYLLNDGYAVLSLTGAWNLPGQNDDIRYYKMLAQFFPIDQEPQN